MGNKLCSQFSVPPAPQQAELLYVRKAYESSFRVVKNISRASKCGYLKIRQDDVISPKGAPAHTCMARKKERAIHTTVPSEAGPSRDPKPTVPGSAQPGPATSPRQAHEASLAPILRSLDWAQAKRNEASTAIF